MAGLSIGCSALDAAISYITASAISPFEVHFGDFLGTRNAMSFPGPLLPSIVGILGMAISGPGHNPEPPMRRSFDRSQDFLPRDWEKSNNLAFIPVGKTNDSQTTTATIRRFVVLRSTTVRLEFTGWRDRLLVVRP